jgi:hypothetical protein
MAIRYALLGRLPVFRIYPDWPPHIPTDPLSVDFPPDRVRGPTFPFRKIHLYGKTKKPAHGRTKFVHTLHPEKISDQTVQIIGWDSKNPDRFFIALPVPEL